MRSRSMGVRASRMSRSQVINNDLHPKWNEDFKLLVHEPEHQVNISAPAHLRSYCS